MLWENNCTICVNFSVFLGLVTTYMSFHVFFLFRLLWHLSTSSHQGDTRGCHPKSRSVCVESSFSQRGFDLEVCFLPFHLSECNAAYRLSRSMCTIVFVKPWVVLCTSHSRVVQPITITKMWRAICMIHPFLFCFLSIFLSLCGCNIYLSSSCYLLTPALLLCL